MPVRPLPTAPPSLHGPGGSHRRRAFATPQHRTVPHSWVFISPWRVRGVSSCAIRVFSLVSIMATRDISETTLDEDGQTNANATQCPECDGRIITDAVETICEDCGLIIDEQQIDHGPEWRAYDDDQCERTGAPLTVARHDRGLSTEIGRGNDANGNALSERKRQQVARMRREQTRGRFQSKAERKPRAWVGRGPPDQ